MNFLLKILKAKTRTEIRNGKLWEITTLFGRDISTVEKEAPQAAEFVKPEAMQVDKIRVHVIKSENNITNLTKDADFV